MVSPMGETLAESPSRTVQPRLRIAAGVIGAALAVATLVVQGLDLNGVAWAASQLLWTAVAVVDLEQRRVPNAVTGPAAVVVLVLRSLFARSGLLESVVAALVIGAIFLLFAIVARGGFGMGDVKLAAVIGLILGRDAVGAVLLGVLAGSLASIAVYLRARSRRATFAYAPYLAGGAALVTVIHPGPALL